MIKLLLKLVWRLIFLPLEILPESVKIRTDAERYGIDRFIDYAVTLMKPTDRLLDAGAGSGRYRQKLSFTQYQSTDFSDVFDKPSLSRHDFICNLEKIPKADNSYDVIVNTQVLEHVEYPQQVIKEFYRVLKSGGKLFLTTNQMWGIHGAPYNFYFYTKYGLESLFRNTGFKIIFIKPRGGIFWFLGKLSKELPHYIFHQHMFGGYKENISFLPRFQPTLTGVILIPFFVISVYLLGLLVPLLCFYLDWLDRQKYFTLGYQCYCVKE